MRHINSLRELRSQAGQELGHSSWHAVRQDDVNEFAKLTGDEQWIHTDPERAAAESPFGATVAHGFLTLSLLDRLLRQAVRFGFETKLWVNYGFNRLRFTAPVLVGSQVQGVFRLSGVREFDGGVDLTLEVQVNAKDESRPRLVAEWIVRAYL